MMFSIKRWELRIGRSGIGMKGCRIIIRLHIQCLFAFAYKAACQLAMETL